VQNRSQFAGRSRWVLSGVEAVLPAYVTGAERRGGESDPAELPLLLVKGDLVPADILTAKALSSPVQSVAYLGQRCLPGEVLRCLSVRFSRALLPLGAAPIAVHGSMVWSRPMIA
jgi:hypothetical protein